MFEYRVFFVGHDGHIKAAEEMTCASDAEACEAALNILTDCPVREVWSGERRIAVIPPAEPQAASAEFEDR